MSACSLNAECSSDATLDATLVLFHKAVRVLSKAKGCYTHAMLLYVINVCLRWNDSLGNPIIVKN